MVNVLLVGVGEGGIAAHGDPVRLGQGSLPLQHALLLCLLLLCIHVLVVLVLLENHVHAPSHFSVGVRWLVACHVSCLGRRNHRASDASAHPPSLRRWRLLTGLGERVLRRREDVVPEEKRRAIALLRSLVVAHRRVVV